jgi:excisionase family DNA binding protein
LAPLGSDYPGGSGRASVSNDEILTLKEIAQLLKVAEKTVCTMAQNSELPAFKVRGQWRFRREDIDRWIDQQMEKAAGGGLG